MKHMIRDHVSSGFHISQEDEVFDELEETRKSVTDAIANLKRVAKGVME